MGAPEPVLTLRRSVNAAAFRKVATGQTRSEEEEYTSNWFVRRQQDCGTPIFDQLASERRGVIEFLNEGPIQVELFWPKGQDEDADEETIFVGSAAGNSTEGATK